MDWAQILVPGAYVLGGVMGYRLMDWLLTRKRDEPPMRNVTPK